ncbi:MAG TPA: hypothetical protein VGM19_09645 [Armatimonadota bacterium]
MPRLTTATICALLLLICGSSGLLAESLVSQSAPESFSAAQGIAASPSLVPTRSALESVMSADGKWAQGANTGDLGNSNLSLAFGGGLSMSRAVRNSMTTLQGAPLNTGLVQNLTDTLSLALGARTQFSFSRQLDTTQNLLSDMVAGSETRKMGLTQGFGSGATAGSFSFERGWATALSGNSLVKTNIQSMGLTTGLGHGLSLTSKFNQQWDGQQFGNSSNAFEAGLGMALSGGQGALSFASTDTTAGLHRSGSDLIKLAAPFAMFGGKANFATTRKVSYADASQVADDLTTLALPLPGGLAFSGNLHEVASSVPGGQMLHDQGWALDFPSFFGKKGHFDTQRLNQNQTGLVKALSVDNLVLPLGFVDHKGILEYHAKDEVTNGQTVRTTSGQFATPLPLAGNQATLAYTMKDNQAAGAARLWENALAAFVPVKMFGDTSRLDYRTSTSSNAGVVTRDTLLSLGLVLTSWRKGVFFNQSYESLSTAGVDSTVLTSVFGTPWRGFGTSGDFKQQYITTQFATGTQERLVSDLSAVVNHERFTLQRDLINSNNGGVSQVRDMLALQTPRFQLFTPRATFAVGRTQISDTANPDTTTTTVDVSAQPAKSVTIAARMQQNTADPGTDLTTQQVVTSVALGPRASLQGRMESRDQSDQVSQTTLRSVQFKSEKAGATGLGLLVGYANWDQPGATTASDGEDVQVTVGDPAKGLSVAAQVTGYDATNLTPYVDPLVKISVSHGQPSGLNVKVAYGDQAGQIAPQRSCALGMPALGGSVQLAYAQNPMDRFNKTILLADRYDASLQRSVAGLDLKLDYRVYDFREATAVNSGQQFYRLQLAGGAENQGGKLALGYSMGDFVPQPDPNTAVSSTVLDLSYSRRWADNGRFIVTLQRNTPPTSSTQLQESMTGRLEYSAVF